MGNVAALFDSPLVSSALQAVFVLGSDPIQIEAELTEKLSFGALPIRDVSIGGAGQGQLFCVTVTLSPGDPVTVRGVVYIGSSPAELQRAFGEALERLVTMTAPAAFDILGHTVVGSSDGARFLGVILAQERAADVP